MLHAKFHSHWSTDSGEEVLKVFTIYGGGGGWPYWSCDLDSLNIFSFLKATYEIWLQLAYLLLRKCLKL